MFYPVVHGILIVSSLAFISNLFTRKNSSNMRIVIPQIYVVVKDNIKVTIDPSFYGVVFSISSPSYFC